ncbi:hypothetical protein D3C76_1295540 [compost metagenome]
MATCSAGARPARRSACRACVRAGSATRAARRRSARTARRSTWSPCPAAAKCTSSRTATSSAAARAASSSSAAMHPTASITAPKMTCGCSSFPRVHSRATCAGTGVTPAIVSMPPRAWGLSSSSNWTCVPGTSTPTRRLPATCCWSRPWPPCCWRCSRTNACSAVKGPTSAPCT